MVVLGAGYGDEGKGQTVSYLCSKFEKPLVVRFNGGHQAGHTVIHNGHRHVFSSFGSGTLQNVPTFWSRFCTIYPVAWLNEYELLREFKPMFYYSPWCAITTPFDVLANRTLERGRSVPHGSCGVGFGTTIQRSIEDGVQLYAHDLRNRFVLSEKLHSIKRVYERWGIKGLNTVDFSHFFNGVRALHTIGTMTDGLDSSAYDEVIYEGAQGILLDQDFGFAPHVTWSNTTSKNTNLIGIDVYGDVEKVMYVTRCYSTRHGNGPLAHESDSEQPKITNNENETNRSQDFQGKFRTALLDIDLLKHAIECDKMVNRTSQSYLMITCADQMDERFKVIKGDRIVETSAMGIADLVGLNFQSVTVRYGQEHLEHEITR